MRLISKQWLQLVGKHFIINDYNDIHLEMADNLSQTLCSPVILRRESINDTASGKCLRVSWCYEPFKFFFFNIEIVFRLFAWLSLLIWLNNIYHVLLIKEFEVIFKPGPHSLGQFNYLPIEKVEGLFSRSASIEVAKCILNEVIIGKDVINCHSGDATGWNNFVAA